MPGIVRFAFFLSLSLPCVDSFSSGSSSDNPKKHISAAQQARREEEARRKSRCDENIPGKTSAIPGAKDFEINIQRTQLEWTTQASPSERDVKESTRIGMEALRMLQLEEAEKSFATLFSIKPDAYCWQAGVVKFYLGDYYGAAEIFKCSAEYYERKFGQVASEERIWRNACELKLMQNLALMKGKKKAKRDGLDPPIASIQGVDEDDSGLGLLAPKETRKVVRIASEMFSSSLENDTSRVALSRAKLRSICGEYDGTSNVSRQIDMKMWRVSSWYYLGLHYDCVGDIASSKDCMKMALRQCIGGGNSNGSDLMQTLPMLHMSRREWFDDDDFEEDDGSTSSFLEGEFDDNDSGTIASSIGTSSDFSDPLGNDPSESSAAEETIKKSLDTMRLSELQESLRKHGLKTTGSKTKLKERLLRCLLEDARYE